nr:hypothetical protein [Streptomyces minutiscleroticus]
MTSTYPAGTGRRRRSLVPPPGEPASRPQQIQDPPIYRDLLRSWADRGRTLPGRHDPEWARLAAPSALYGPGRVSATRDPRGDAR